MKSNTVETRAQNSSSFLRQKIKDGYIFEMRIRGANGKTRVEFPIIDFHILNKFLHL